MFSRQVRSVKLLNFKQLRNDFPVTTKKCNLSSNGNTNDVEKSQPPQLTQWRKPWSEREGEWFSKLKVFSADDQPDANFITFMQRPFDLSPSGLKRWWSRRRLEIQLTDQKFLRQRHELLGCDLASAHFIVHRGGKVKFLGKKEWVKKDEEEQYDLPSTFRSDYIIEALDLSGMELYYEGLENLCRLTQLKWLSFKGCPQIDDWCMDRISGEYPRLEYLDVSDCEKVTERGLEALYRLQNLKTLVVTNHYDSPAFELTCMMLEDCNPNLKCDIVKPKKLSQPNKELSESPKTVG